MKRSRSKERPKSAKKSTKEDNANTESKNANTEGNSKKGKDIPPLIQELTGKESKCITETINILSHFAKLMQTDLAELNSLIHSAYVPKDLREQVTTLITQVQAVRMQCVEFSCQIMPLVQILKSALTFYQFQKQKVIFSETIEKLAELKVEEKLKNLLEEVKVPLQASAGVRKKLADVKIDLPKIKEELEGTLDKIMAHTIEAVTAIALTVGVVVSGGMLAYVAAITSVSSASMLGIAYANKLRKEQMLEKEQHNINTIITKIVEAEDTLDAIISATTKIRVVTPQILSACKDPLEEYEIPNVRANLDALDLFVRALFEASTNSTKLLAPPSN